MVNFAESNLQINVIVVDIFMMALSMLYIFYDFQFVSNSKNMF